MAGGQNKVDTLAFIERKYSINIGERSPITIPNMVRADLAALSAELGFTTGAEIGVLLGRYSKMLCEANPKLKLHCIDPWLAYEEYKDLTPQENMDYLYNKTKEDLKPFNCNIVRAKSMDVVNDFDDNSLDFVYIDGNHEFTSEANDIHEWSKKVHPGGIISGHDYRKYRYKSFSHTYEVLHAYTSAYNISPWFITDHKNEQIRSWFWVKKKQDVTTYFPNKK